MKSLSMTTFVLLVGTSAVWLASTIDPLMLAGSLCSEHGPAPYQHCWRCPALAASLIILIAAAFHQILPKTLRH